MTKKLNKRGFTIVELVVVIVVIAILAAVLIPTVSSLVAKANQSADIQAVRQMNTALEICDETPKNIADAKNALSNYGYDASEYKPLSNGCEFYWVSSLNRVVLINESNEVVYPTSIATEAKNAENNWFSLSASGNYTKVEELNNQIASNQGDIVLSGTTNFKGASINLKPTSNITIGGESEQSLATITNIVSDEGSRVNAGKDTIYENSSYYCGLISEVPAGTTVTIQNLVIDGAVIGDTTNPDSAQTGIIAGSVSGTLNIKNVTIKNCTVFGQYKVGALVGCVESSGTVNVENVTISDTTVKGCQITAALIGQVEKSSTISFTNVTTNNVSVEFSDFNNDGYHTTNFATNVNGDKFVTYDDGQNNGLYYAYLTDNHMWIADGAYAGVALTAHPYKASSENIPSASQSSSND